MNNGPLDGIRVIDLSTVFMGPYATLLLQQMGAEIIKVEPPDGDIARYVGPARNRGMSSVFLNVAQGKKSVVLDLKSEEGYTHLLGLVTDADVVLHTMRPEAAERLQIDYETLREINAGLIYCSGPGYREQGEDRNAPAYDDVIQGRCGLAWLQGFHGDPTYVVPPIADKTTGIMLAMAVIGALYHREVTGQGQKVTVPMFDVMTSYVLLEQLGGWAFDPPIGPPTYSRTVSEYRKPYRAKDGHVCVVPYTDRQWRNFFECVGSPGLAEDPRFIDMPARTANIDELYQHLETAIGEKTVDEWIAALGEVDIPCARVNSIQDLLDGTEPGTAPTILEYEHPTEGTLRLPGFPIQFSAFDPPQPAHAPLLREHTSEVLGVDVR